MKTCPKCNNNHKKPGTFCSRNCANSRQWTIADKQKKSKAAKQFFESLTEEQKTEIAQKRAYNLSSNRKVLSEKQYSLIFANSFNDLSFFYKRIRVILEQNNSCDKCGLDTWLELPIVLELEHKDGNRENNDRENLHALCPNCHSQTPTWRGRKKKIGFRNKILLELQNVHKGV